ncbi:hypothetical protein ACFPM7_27385 [Actinokineospora guangxiensis]|uniref:Uncharacterized protein n=1 Tax=Actinokineospora guangxiensis TaxID=1490288 RepID=A0ABW0EX91_9PSEU
MTQATAGKGSERTALPVRVHDILLALAGRLDDDALAQARELLAATEVDRALELTVGCLVAGPIQVTSAERAELSDLLVAAHCDPAVAARLPVSETAGAHHRFVAGRVDGVAPDEGVGEAAARVLDVLPDIRAVWAVWRTTPAGAVSGPVPHRVVLIGVGPAGFAPATAYRVQHSLRRAGLTASVEVLREGADHSDYHHTAVRYATEVYTDAAALSPSSALPQSSVLSHSTPPSHSASASHAITEPRSTPTSHATPLAEVPPPPAADEDLPAGPSWMEEAAASQPPPDSLNDHELDLLRQLQEELARREQEADGTAQPTTWQGDLPGANHPFDWHEANTMVNGVPLQPPDQRP